MTARKGSEKNREQATSGVESVPLASLPRKRRSKHYELMQEVLRELSRLASDSAVKVPLGSKSAKELRSAVVRAASSQNIRIASTSDGDNLYVWKKRG